MNDWLTLAGLCITASVSCFSAYLTYLTKIQSNRTAVVADTTHQMVNSKFDALVRENAALAARIAELTGTADDNTRADVAQERIVK